jgi:hypothetical protein
MTEQNLLRARSEQPAAQAGCTIHRKRPSKKRAGQRLQRNLIAFIPLSLEPASPGANCRSGKSVWGTTLWTILPAEALTQRQQAASLIIDGLLRLDALARLPDTEMSNPRHQEIAEAQGKATICRLLTRIQDLPAACASKSMNPR